MVLRFIIIDQNTYSISTISTVRTPTDHNNNIESLFVCPCRIQCTHNTPNWITLNVCVDKLHANYVLRCFVYRRQFQFFNLIFLCLHSIKWLFDDFSNFILLLCAVVFRNPNHIIIHNDWRRNIPCNLTIVILWMISVARLASSCVISLVEYTSNFVANTK